MLLVIMLMAALIMIGLAMELPAIGVQIRRDREQELIHRGAQYARAIKRFYKKTGAYPVRLEQLEDTNHIRFLRKKYKDPMTGEEFRLLRFGDPQLSLKTPGAPTGPGVAAGSGVTTGQGSTSTPQVGSPLGSPSATGNRPGGTGQTFGGGPIVGVASNSKKPSLHVFNQKDHYNDWEFIYDPTQDRGALGGLGPLIKGPYNGPQTVSGGTVPGAVTPGQMNNPPAFGPSGTFGQPANPAPAPQPH
jgi:type II secretory pathway pseudopilin PulG